MESGRKKAVKITALVLVAVVIAAAIVLSGLAIARAVEIDNAENYAIEYGGGRMNVIFMIGDGMGFNHVAAAEAKYGELFFTGNADVSGEVTTFSRNVFGPTDSAAAATALATGRKTGNGQIGQYNGKEFQSLAEVASGRGMSVGIIATEGVDGATPSGFSAHTSSRNDIDGILEDQLAGGIDLFFGSNAERYVPLKDKIEGAGYTFAESLSQAQAAEGKVFAAFEEVPPGGSGGTKPSLSSLTAAALDKLSADEDGFFLMVEESHIDKCSHSNDLAGALEHVRAYDEAVRTAVEYAERIGNTLVIVTADHETGGLQYNGETADKLNDGMYTRGSHSSANVPYFVFGDIDYEFADVMDNTWLSRLCRAVLSA